jgi:hypothetical protein
MVAELGLSRGRHRNGRIRVRPIDLGVLLGDIDRWIIR